MRMSSFRNFCGFSLVLFFSLAPMQAQFGTFGKKLKEKVVKVAKEVSEEVKQGVESEIKQEKNPVQTPIQQSVVDVTKPKGGKVLQKESDPLSIMKTVQVAEQTDDSFYAQAYQRDNGGAFDEKLDLRAQFECLAYYLLKLKKAVERRDIEYMAWPDDNKHLLYFSSVSNNPSNRSIADFSWNDWSAEYDRVTGAVNKIMLAPFTGSWNGSSVSLIELLSKIDGYINSKATPNQKKYYLFAAVQKLTEGLYDGRLRDEDLQVQTLVASLKKTYSLMDKEYQDIYPKPMNRREIDERYQQQKKEQISRIQEEYNERKNRVYDMPKAGRMNTPQMVATFEQIMQKQWPNDKIVKTLIKSDEWTIQDNSTGRYRVVFGYVIVKKPDGRYQAIPCSMAGKWSPGAGKFGAYNYHSLGTPFYVNYR